MAKKARKPSTKDQPKPKRKENVIERIAEEVEAHLIEGAELATSTTSAETNVALAALGAIEGPRAPKEPKPERKDNAAKRSKPRSKAR